MCLILVYLHGTGFCITSYDELRMDKTIDIIRRSAPYHVSTKGIVVFQTPLLSMTFLFPLYENIFLCKVNDRILQDQMISLII